MCCHTVPLLTAKGENSVVSCYSLNKYTTTGKEQQERQICRCLYRSTMAAFASLDLQPTGNNGNIHISFSEVSISSTVM